MNQDATERLNFRKVEEAGQVVEILERLKTLGLERREENDT